MCYTFRMTNILRNASLGLIYLTLFIPLYVDYNLFFPFITGKAFAFRIIVEILTALWLLLILRDKKYAPRFSWIGLCLSIFAVVVLIADLAGLSPLRSIWSNFERMEGWLMIIHLWAYFVVVTSIFGTGEEGRRMWHRFFNISLVAASIVGIYGFFQFFGWAVTHQGARIDASLGNAAYMAVYMLFHVFFALYMSLVASDRNRKGQMWMYIILAALFAFLLFETATRGTILGLVGGILLALAIYAVGGKGMATRSRIYAGTTILVIILLGIGLVAAKNTEFVQKNETLRRLATISISENKTQARGYIWPMAVRGVFESPKTALIGVGQENFNYIFNANYNPKMWSQEQWFDRAHSVFLDWLVAGGLAGFVLYILLFILTIVGVWRSGISFREKTLLTGLVLGYAIHNIFVFDNLASYMLFVSILGFVHALSAGNPLRWLERRDDQSENTVVVRDYIWMPLIIVGLVATLYFINIRPLQANIRLIDAMAYCAAGKADASLFGRALELNQYVANQEIREQVLTCASQTMNAKYAPGVREAFYLLSLQEVSKQIAATPLDARIYVIGGLFFNGIGDWQNSGKLLEKANELSPNKQTIIYELATYYVNTGKIKEARELMKKAYESAPENHTAQEAYASVLAYMGEAAQVRALYPNDPKKAQEIINRAASMKQGLQ
jgi:O-antigen ligase/Flp pilus assembly protein TadD